MSASPPSGELRRAQDPEVVRAHERDVTIDIASARGPGGPNGRALAARPAARGSILILVGTIVFGVACFLPFFTFGATTSDGTMSLWQVSVMQRHSLLAQIGGALALFGGPAVVVALAVGAIRRATSSRRPALLAAASVWTLSWVGTVTNDVFPGGHGKGFWMVAAGVLAVALGALLVWLDAARATPGPASPDAA